MFDYQHRVNSVNFLKIRSLSYGIYIGLEKLLRPKNINTNAVKRLYIHHFKSKCLKFDKLSYPLIIGSAELQIVLEDI